MTSFGENVVALVPLTTPFSAAQLTASTYQLSVRSVKGLVFVAFGESAWQ